MLMWLRERINMNSIKFNQQGIEAILNGSKTMTRRPIKLPKYFNIDSFGTALDDNYSVIEARFDDYDADETIFIKPKYKVGETVFVQEEFCLNEEVNEVVYRADYESGWSGFCAYWSPSSKMTEKEARIFLKITNIKVERLQDISEEDCIKEGIYKKEVMGWGSRGGEYPPMPTQNFAYTTDGNTGYLNAVDCFEKEIWNNLPYKAPYDWNSNPYVFVYEFEVV